MATRRLGGIATSSSVPDNGGDHSGGGSAGGYVDDVFSTYLYEGTGAAQDIENGVDLEGEGGMVWTKNRYAARAHALYDSERGPGWLLKSNAAEQSKTYPDSLASFNSDGFSLGSDGSMITNVSGENYASWTFRKQPKFFDLVTYTGTGTQNRSVPHNLGCRPGMVIVKSIDQSRSWSVWHNSFPEWTGNTTDGDVSGGNATGYLLLDKKDEYSNRGYFTHVNDSSFGVNFNRADLNADGETYVAYVFAHDDSDESIIKCGSYTGNGAFDGTEVELGFEPQWVMVKSFYTDYGWYIYDAMRGTVSGDKDAQLLAHEADAETSPYDAISFTPTGFKLDTNEMFLNGNGQTYTYIAIRRPNKPAEEFEAEELFGMATGSGNPAPNFTSGFPVDMHLLRYPNSAGDINVSARLTSGKALQTNQTSAESALADYVFDYQNGVMEGGFGSTAQAWMWRRAPGFFDVVVYEGNQQVREIPHNLGVEPEMMWVKCRSQIRNWMVYSKEAGASMSGLLQGNFAFSSDSQAWSDTAPTEEVFTVGASANTNFGGEPMIAYLFASAPGISKVGSYSGTGAEIDVDCGFTTGARFVLIKRTDSNGDWYVWDTERGITGVDDPYVLLNDTAAQVTDTDYIDPLSSGFKVTANANAAINASDGEYIFYAIA